MEGLRSGVNLTSVIKPVEMASKSEQGLAQIHLHNMAARTAKDQWRKLKLVICDRVLWTAVYLHGDHLENATKLVVRAQGRGLELVRIPHRATVGRRAIRELWKSKRNATLSHVQLMAGSLNGLTLKIVTRLVEVVFNEESELVQIHRRQTVESNARDFLKKLESVIPILA